MERKLKTYNINTKVYCDSIVIANKEVGEGYLFEYKCEDIFLTGRGDYPFMALAAIRRQLVELNLLLLCEGSRVDVFPSGFSFSSYLAYKVCLGKRAEKENLVHILDPTDEIAMIGTFEEQESYRVKWGESLENE